MTAAPGKRRRSALVSTAVDGMHSRLALLLGLLCALRLQASCEDEFPVYPYLPVEQGLAPSPPRVCVVIRTYWGQAGPTGLRALLQSLQRQSVPE